MLTHSATVETRASNGQTFVAASVSSLEYPAVASFLQGLKPVSATIFFASKLLHYPYNIMALYPLNFIKSVVRQAFDTGEGSHTTPKLDEQ